MYPFCSNFVKYPWTVAVELNPTDFPISRSYGGYPFSFICFSINAKISFSLFPNSSLFFLGIYISPLKHTKKMITYIGKKVKQKFCF